MAKKILVLDLATRACGSDGCGQLSGLLRKSLGPHGFTVRTASAFSALSASSASTAGERPDLIALRTVTAETLSSLAEIGGAAWRSVPLLGVFCALADGEPAAPLLDRLDDFVCCPVRPADMAVRVHRLLRRAGPAVRAAQSGERSRTGLESLLGESLPILRVLEKIPRLASADAPVMITGETGTGKELAARAVHARSERRAKPFVALNCGAMPEALVENELFGHARGAFTDASSSEEGLLAAAEKGTLFLDEIDALGPAAQVKLLRLLQTWEYRPLGSTRVRQADVRILAATNADLPAMVAQKRFREDLFYRLNVLCLHMPPLRERPGDVGLLAVRFLERFAERHNRAPLCFAAEVLERLSWHSWPGNVRELEAVVQRAVLLGSGPELGLDDLELPGAGPTPGPAIRGGLREARAYAVDTAERTCLVHALAAFHGNVSRAAQSVGKERRTFQRLMRKHAIERSAFLPVA
jgi:two-component system, NtrC family, response regulator GlrR